MLCTHLLYLRLPPHAGWTSNQGSWSWMSCCFVPCWPGSRLTPWSTRVSPSWSSSPSSGWPKRWISPSRPCPFLYSPPCSGCLTWASPWRTSPTPSCSSSSGALPWQPPSPNRGWTPRSPPRWCSSPRDIWAGPPWYSSPSRRPSPCGSATPPPPPWWCRWPSVC